MIFEHKFFEYKKKDSLSYISTMKEIKRGKYKILIIDDEEYVCRFLSDVLSKKYECTAVSSVEKAFKELKEHQFALILSDINLRNESGIEIAKFVKEKSFDTVVVMISGKSDIEAAIEAMRAGAFDYIKKPFDLENLELAVMRALEHYLSLVSKREYEHRLKSLLEKRDKEIDYLSWYDPHTNLPNRFLFEDRLSQAIEQASHGKRIIATTLISISQLKLIYSNLGPKYGDEVLRKAAEKIKNCISVSDTLARFDDKFAVLMTKINKEQEAVDLIERIVDALKEPIPTYDEEIPITINAGISIFPNDCKTAQEALKNASTALERSKEEGVGSWLFFTSDLTEKSLMRLKMEINLRRAIEKDELELYFQPKVEVSSGKIIGAEALLRWNKSEEIIPPAEFIHLAEEVGLIIPIGDWVLRNVFHQCALWAEKREKLTVSVNLSAYQLREKNFVEKVRRMVEETGVDTNLLEFEVTESMILKNPEESAATLGELRKLGIKILIDDFGTGYSSLAYLKKLPLDGLKIDRTFIKDFSSENPNDAEFIIAIITLAHNLRLKVVAEGVETEEQWKLLRLVRCDEAQGYLFGKPMLPEMFANLWK